MNLEIRSHEGVGPINFGMSPNEVRAAVGLAFESFKRTPKSVYPCDYFPELQCFVYYGATGKAEAVEFADPAAPSFRGVNLLGMGFAELVERVNGYDAGLVVESDGFTSLKIGFGAYAPEAEENPLAAPESVIVFDRGYYD